jgi:superoxide reductase
MSSEIFWRINTEKSSEDKPMGEKHAPAIALPAQVKAGDKFKVRVFVGGGKHPNLSEHHIQWVELRVDGLYVARAEFAAVITEPEVEFTVVCPHRKFTEVSALARCNLHGLWESKATLSFVE